MVGRDTPEPIRLGRPCKTSQVQAVVVEPRIPCFSCGECQKDTDWLSAFVQYKTVKNATHVLKDGAIFIYSGSKAVTCSGLHFYDANGNLLHRERYALYNSSYGDFKLAKNGSVVQYATDKIEDGATYSMKYDD